MICCIQLWVCNELWCAADEQSGFKRPEFLAVIQIDEDRLLIDCEPDVVFVVIDPHLLPFAGIQVPRAFDADAPRLTIDGKLERQFVIFNFCKKREINCVLIDPAPV